MATVIINMSKAALMAYLLKLLIELGILAFAK